jgi:hypothetical protein
MRNETRSLIWGILLIIFGFLFLGHNLGWFYFDWEYIWPLLLIIGGLLFWIGWLAKRQEYGLLMPGTILLVYGLMFQYSAMYGWYYMDDLWPGFLLGPGLGFFFMYLLGTREKGLLIPAFILSLLALLFWSGRDAFRYFWPLILIAAGIYLLFRNRNKWNETQVNKMENKTDQEGSNK